MHACWENWQYALTMQVPELENNSVGLQSYRNITCNLITPQLLLKKKLPERGIETPHCSRITRYINFIALDIFHLPTFKYDVDNLNWLKKPNSHREFLRKSKIFKKGNFFIEFCIINMQKWSNFMKESIKYSRILWNLKQILQYSQKHSPKGHMVKLFSDVTKNLFYDKSCVFSKNSTCI